MTEQTKMDQATYDAIAEEPDKSNWEMNVVLLRKAIQHIDDGRGTLWGIIMPILPGELPYARQGAKLEGIQAIFVFRSEISRRLGGFEALQNSGKFGQTKAWESSRDKDDLGYSDDGFIYTLHGATLKMKWDLDENTSRYGCYEEFPISPEDLRAVFSVDTMSDGEHEYRYRNGVDHLYTKLVWNVVSGTQTSIFRFKDSGLHYSVADILGCDIEPNEPNAKMLNPFLHDPYYEMLNAAVKES